LSDSAYKLLKIKHTDIFKMMIMAMNDLFKEINKLYIYIYPHEKTAGDETKYWREQVFLSSFLEETSYYGIEN
jgi:hypothetical protein